MDNFTPSSNAIGIKKSISVSSEHSNNSEIMELVHSSTGSINFSSSLSGAETTTTATTTTTPSNSNSLAPNLSASSPIHHHSSHNLSPKKLWGSIDLINRRKFSAQAPPKLGKNEEGGEVGKAGGNGGGGNGGGGASQGTLDKSESPTGSPKTGRKMWYGGGSKNASINSVGTDGSGTPKAGVSAHRDSIGGTVGEGGGGGGTMTTPPKHKLLTGIKDVLNKARKSLPNIAAGSIDKFSSLNMDPLEEEYVYASRTRNDLLIILHNHYPTVDLINPKKWSST